MSDLYIGVMTGNSMDAADAVLADIGNDNFQLLAAANETIDEELAGTLRKLAESPTIAVETLLTAQNALTEVCAKAVAKLPQATTAKAIGCHGQTLAHRPAAGVTWQLLNGALLAEITGVDVVCDFRARDVASGGEGAPLAPLFHRHYFAAHAPCDVVNIGGIANITHLRPPRISGYDVGPGMILSDACYRLHRGGRYDDNGDFAATGTISDATLRQWMAHPFFRRQPPKSGGREEFSPAHFKHDHLSARDAQATVVELTARPIAAACTADNVFICGGGGKNAHLMRRLAALMPDKSVRLSDAVGLPAQQVEAALFAWLAKCRLHREALATTPVTGGKPRVAGAHYSR